MYRQSFVQSVQDHLRRLGSSRSRQLRLRPRLAFIFCIRSSELVFLYFSGHFDKRFLEDGSAEDSLEDAVVYFNISVFEVEAFHDLLDACIFVGHKVLRDEHVGYFTYWQVHILVLSALCCLTEPLVDDVHFLAEVGPSISVHGHFVIGDNLQLAPRSAITCAAQSWT